MENKTKESNSKRKIYDNGFRKYYYKCQHCESENVEQVNDGSFSPPKLVCNTCGAKDVTNSTRVVKETSRELAIEWWDKLRLTERVVEMNKFGIAPYRSSDTLTGTEIEKIWKNYLCLSAYDTDLKTTKKEDIDFIIKHENHDVLSNKKIFKEFNPELFVSYCNKFQEKDKLTLAEIAIVNCDTISYDDISSIINIIRKYR